MTIRLSPVRLSFIRLSHRIARLRGMPVRVAVVAVLAALAVSVAGCSDVLGAGDSDLEILWPDRNATLFDEEVLRARVRHRHLDDYEIYWYVDDSRERRMWNEWDASTPHKAYLVDTWLWDWRGRGPYTVGFIAEDYQGRVIARRTVRVYVE
ncbi:MAG: hypothetical protein ACREK1_12175 [Longimicrobiales bacterium]